MSDGPSPARSTLKIVLWIVLGVCGLCVLCCGALLFTYREEVPVIWRTAWFMDDLQTEFGAGTQIHIEDAERTPFLLAVGIPGFDPEKAEEVQDRVWKLYVARFAEGAMPVERIAVGSPGKGGSARTTWLPEHEVDVEDLVERTGLAAPTKIVLGPGRGGSPPPDEPSPPTEAPPPEEPPK